MHVTPLIKIIIPKYKLTVEREGNVRSRFASLWGYPIVFNPTSCVSCCTGHRDMWSC